MKTVRPKTRPAAGFTLVEVLLAAMVTALVATTAATIVSAVSSASTQTRDVRTTKQAGHYALGRIATAVREARGIGEVTADSVTLWMSDRNGNDAISVDEASIIRYDAVAKTISCMTPVPPAGNGSLLDILADILTDLSLLRAEIEKVEHTTEVWASDVESLSFQGYPSLTDTKIIQVHFTMGAEEEAVAFSTSAAPRAPGDYLFVNGASEPANAASPRIRRLVISPWQGLSTISD
jgi:type II secretory pathway pseudopilin PulG